MSLRRLNDEVKAKIRSGAVICSACGCVRELVYNSLDAGATHVIVKLDISKHFVQVIDNGCGISHEDMIVLGGQSFTSKWHKHEDLDSIGTMGFRGEALFSICGLTGTVEVCSRHQLSSETWCKLFHHGKDLGVIHSNSHCKSVGTTVTLRDMFFSMPVRQKCIKESLEVEHIRQMVQQTALVNPHISFVVENGTTGKTIIKYKKVHSVLERISHLYGYSIAKSMRLVEHKADNYYVSGYLSTELSSNKSLQLISINKRLVCQNQVHTLLDDLLNHQIYSKIRTERLYPQYLIAIQCPPSGCDFYYQSSKTFVEFVDWSNMLKTISVAVKDVISSTGINLDILTKAASNEDNLNSSDGKVSHEVASTLFSHGMQSKRVQKAATAALINDRLSCGDISSSSSQLDVTNKFIGVKAVSRSPLHTSSIAQKLAQFFNEKRFTPENVCSLKLPTKRPISDVLISPFIPLDHSTPLQASHSSDTSTPPSHTNANNKQRHTSNSTSYCAASSKPLLAAPHLSHDTTPFVSGKRISLRLSEQAVDSGTKQLTNVGRLLSEWNNPVFKTGQEHIMTTSQCHVIHHYQFTKKMFDNIRVIGQVDNKFIACLMDTKDNGTHDLLVLVDQHAAHERVRLERLTAELCSEGVYGNLSGQQIHSSVLEPAVKLHGDKNMLSAIATFHAQLKTVGIDLSEANGLVTVNKLPSVLVNNKLPIVSTATIEAMIIEHIEHLSNTGGASHVIPHVLTDFLATQACHGAIKFNDPLTWDECQKLMESLSQCNLPFQCAHGRPSLIPLLDISSLDKK